MTTKHTPGPWSYAADDKLNADRAFGVVRTLGAQFDAEAGTEGATEVIAEVCGDDGSGTAEADARLIAAAPDLLAFAQYVAEHGECELLCRMARAAIAKATGEPA